MKKVFRIKVKVKGCNIKFDDKLDIGVLAERDLEYDLKPEEYESPIFWKSLIEEKDRLLDEVIFTESRELIENPHFLTQIKI